MLEYVYLDFKPFGINGDRVASLTEYLEFISSEDHVAQMPHPQLKIAFGISNGVAYLHSRDIVHRDIKTGNVLVSNKHYCELKDRSSIEKAWLNEGIVAKSADFGESRSTMHQTATVLHTRTVNFERGTLAYTSPELLLAEKVILLG